MNSDIFNRSSERSLIYNLSAALRNNISVMRMASDLIEANLKGSYIAPELETYFSMFLHSYYSLNRVAGNLSLLSEILSGNFKPDYERTDVLKLSETIVYDTNLVTSEKVARVDFKTSVESLNIITDPTVVEFILYNLISNSLKYTSADGNITVKVDKSESSFILSVVDTGCGMEPEKIEDVFSLSGRLNELTDVKGGVGIGLFLVQEISKALGGHTVIDSTKNKGTTVTVSLPIVYDDSLLFKTKLTKYNEDNITTLLTELADVLDYNNYKPKFLD